MLSDGVDTLSDLELGDVQNLLKQTGVRLFAIDIGQGRGTAVSYAEGFRNLNKLASSSGGAVFRLKKGSELDSIFEHVTDALRR
jgi:hypothetical protein